MAKKSTTRNRTNKNTETPSQRAARRLARANGRGANSAYTAGARTAEPFQDTAGNRVSRETFFSNAWSHGRPVATVTRSKNGRMSINGRTVGGSTWTYTPKNDDGTPVINAKTGEARQSGRSTIANRRQRDYDTRVGMNNITARTVEKWRQLGWVREVDGSLVGDGQNVRGIAIRQKEDGNYTMGLSVG